ncbi:amidohydrolase [Ornithinibacillus bavariensis]|uniref:Amidohydrolase n=1 Tax=Ornithinibacillus bavariensis TaxID=545502 RepID=A0A920C489_9BACI|nr:amidohydrolase [Ornithinibacillus bavariensis]GIO25451.1 amidohydrolase [Ornithinibacillus bavariensis]
MRKLWYGGTIYTMERENETVEAVLVEADRISAVGSYEELVKQADELYNLNGATMYPGFVDSHLHIIYQGQKLTRLNLSIATTTDEMLGMIREAAKNTPKNQWLFGEGWNENNYPDNRIPTIQELDAIRKEPILLTRICHHVVLGNTAALSAGGYDESSAPPFGGEIGRDADGKLNGLLYEQAANPVTEAILKEGGAYVDELTNILDLAIKDMLSYGLTGGHSEDMSYFGNYKNPLTAYQRVVGKKQHFRVNLLRHQSVFEEMMEDNIIYNDSFIQLGAMKIFVDGALGGSTAALSNPYADQPNNKGLLIQSDDELERLVKLARTHNESVAVHIIGDAGAEQLLTILEKYPLTNGKRDRLIHACLLREDLVERMKKLLVVIDIQPAFVPSDFPWVIDRLGENRLEWAYAWKKLLEHGFMCAAGTDAPVEDINPIATIYAAVERKKPYDSHDGYLPGEKLTRFQAVQLYTLGSAQAICKEHEQGLIKPGYLADFSIFDRDLFEGTSEEMLAAKAVKTVVAGRIVYELATDLDL